jgi:hypothetical protein
MVTAMPVHISYVIDMTSTLLLACRTVVLM